ncbi:hypothetical protein HYW82_04520 [Candidatus Peregrinibacteria bacterium]|nr:hypothetical protein [Candidatus Peregrinibacteria bacterium]
MEISRDLIQQQAAICIGDFCARKDIEDLKKDILIEVSTILDLLPENVAFPEMLNRRCCTAASIARDRFSEKHGVEATLLEELKLDIRAEANLLLLQERIEKWVSQLLAHCATHKVPKRWSLGSIKKWRGNFLQFWKRNIEKCGDEKFRREILPHLPEEWQANYKTRNLCPYDWIKMDNRQIAEVLQSLQKPRDPTYNTWGLGSIENWVSESGKRWGKSYCDYLLKTADGDTDEYFRINILPLLPAKWKNTFGTKDQIACPHEWKNMSRAQIAEVLNDLHKARNPAENRWGLGSVSHWKGNNGESWGKSFYMYWHKTVESNGDTRFQTEILPLLPAAWQKMYRMQGYTVEFVPDTDDTRTAAEACHDMNGLLRLVHEDRNPNAFAKLVNQLVSEVDRRLPRGGFAVPVEVIERCVHNYLPIGKIVNYCQRAAYLNRLSTFSGETQYRIEGHRRAEVDYAQKSRERTEILVNWIDMQAEMQEEDDKHF